MHARFLYHRTRFVILSVAEGSIRTSGSMTADTHANRVPTTDY